MKLKLTVTLLVNVKPEWYDGLNPAEVEKDNFGETSVVGYIESIMENQDVVSDIEVEVINGS